MFRSFRDRKVQFFTALYRVFLRDRFTPAVDIGDGSASAGKLIAMDKRNSTLSFSGSPAIISHTNVARRIFPRLWRCCSFVRSGRFVTVRLCFHSLVPHSFKAIAVHHLRTSGVALPPQDN